MAKTGVVPRSWFHLLLFFFFFFFFSVVAVLVGGKIPPIILRGTNRVVAHTYNVKICGGPADAENFTLAVGEDDEVWRVWEDETDVLQGTTEGKELNFFRFNSPDESTIEKGKEQEKAGGRVVLLKMNFPERTIFKVTRYWMSPGEAPSLNSKTHRVTGGETFEANLISSKGYRYTLQKPRQTGQTTQIRRVQFNLWRCLIDFPDELLDKLACDFRPEVPTIELKFKKKEESTTLPRKR